jgi:hypothetical protein
VVSDWVVFDWILRWLEQSSLIGGQTRSRKRDVHIDVVLSHKCNNAASKSHLGVQDLACLAGRQPACARPLAEDVRIKNLAGRLQVPVL